jgi:hypothetical protein
MQCFGRLLSVDNALFGYHGLYWVQNASHAEDSYPGRIPPVSS